MEPYNPSYYQSLWEQHGFHPLEGYSSTAVTRIDAAAENTGAIARRCEKRGYTPTR